MINKSFYVRPTIFDNETGGIIYGTEKLYKGYVAPITSQRDMQMYGERISQILVCTLRKNLVKDINLGDVAYINTSPIGENILGENADFKVKELLIGNQFTTIHFEKIQ